MLILFHDVFQNDASGEKLKDLMIEKNMVHSGVAYIKEHVPDQRLEQPSDYL